MSTLKKGWIEKSFGDIVESISINHKKLPKSQYEESGRFPVIDQGQEYIGGYSDDESKVVSENLPLIIFGDHTRAFKYVNQPFIPGADGIKVLKPEGVNAKWLFEIAHVLDFPHKGYARHFQHLKNARIFIPPLDEQKEILSEIEKQFTRLEAGVAALKRVQANLKRYRAAVLKAACEGRLVPTEAELARNEGRKYETGEQLLERILVERRKNWNGRGKYKEPSSSENLSQLPDGWIWATIDQLAELGTGATPKRGTAAYYEGGKIPWVTSAALNKTYVYEAYEFVTERALAETNLTIFPPGTLLVAMYGEGKTRGKCAELRISATTNQAIAGILCSAEIRSYLKLCIWRQYEELRLTASGGVQPNLNLSLVRAINIPLPPLAEQRRIVEEVERRLSVLEEMETAVQANLLRAARLRQAVLARAFKGELNSFSNHRIKS